MTWASFTTPVGLARVELHDGPFSGGGGVELG
jgi:hypothetical protein